VAIKNGQSRKTGNIG